MVIMFFLGEEQDDVFVNGRMLVSAIGINQDPVTGNANGPLGACLVHNRIFDTGKTSFSFTAKQVEKMGREGTMKVIIDISNQQPTKVVIVGVAIVVFNANVDVS